MEVIRAEKGGFCAGVVLALGKLDALLKKEASSGRLLWTLGEIIHNPQVVEGYARRGVRVAETPEEIPPGAVTLIRAHGVPREVKRTLRRRGIVVREATCPKIRRAQRLIRRQAREGRLLLLFGEEGHPEVCSLLSYGAAGALRFAGRQELGRLPLEAGGCYCLAAQTTQNRAAFEEIAAALAARRDCSVTVLRTICEATRLRQEEAIEIAGRVECMVVVGGKSSGNTRRLAEVVAARDVPVVQVETAEELRLEELRRLRRVGLTGGASTPRETIDEVYRRLASRR